MTDQQLIEDARGHIANRYDTDYKLLIRCFEAVVDRFAALQSENAELREENGCLQHNVAAMQVTLDQQAKNCEKLLAEKGREIASREQASIDEHAETHYWRDKARAAESALSRVEAERDAAIKDSVARCCGTCNALTQGAYSGKCMVCALCECVPEDLREYHKKHYFKSLWEWRGAQGEAQGDG